VIESQVHGHTCCYIWDYDLSLEKKNRGGSTRPSCTLSCALALAPWRAGAQQPARPVSAGARTDGLRRGAVLTQPQGVPLP